MENSLILNLLVQMLGEPERKKNEFLFFCKFCNHPVNPKLSVNLEKECFKCWACDMQGKTLNLLFKKFGTFEQFQKYRSVSEKHVDLEKILLDEETIRDHKTKTTLPAEFVFLPFARSEIAKKAKKYLKSRGLLLDDICKWKIGVCEKGSFFGRVVIPSFDQDGDVNFYVARSIFSDSVAPFIYPDIKKNNIVFNEMNIKWKKGVRVFLCEGVFDAIKISSCKKKNVIPLIGKTISKNSILLEKLVFYEAEIVLCLDNDIVNGEVVNRSFELAKMLLEFDLNNIQVLDPYPFKDFGEIPEDQVCSFLNKETIRINSFSDILERELFGANS